MSLQVYQRPVESPALVASRTIAQSSRYFPYPYSGVTFAYRVPTIEGIDPALADINIGLAQKYHSEILKALGSRYSLDGMVFVYPNPSSPDNLNFLQLIKVLQWLWYINRPIVGDYSLLRNFFPGNPHMQSRWLLNLNKQDGDSDFIQYIPPEVKNRYTPHYDKMLNSPSWQESNMYPIDETRRNFLVLQYLTRAEIKSPTGALLYDPSKFYYCGDVQLSWELAASKSEQGNFEICRDQFQKQSDLLKTYKVRTIPSELILDETVDDIVELMTREPRAIKTLDKERESLNYLTVRRTRQIDDIKRKITESLTTGVPNIEPITEGIKRVETTTANETKELAKLKEKRRRLEENIVAYNQDIFRPLTDEDIQLYKRQKPSQEETKLEIPIPPSTALNPYQFSGESPPSSPTSSSPPLSPQTFGGGFPVTVTGGASVNAYDAYNTYEDDDSYYSEDDDMYDTYDDYENYFYY